MKHQESAYGEETACIAEDTGQGNNRKPGKHGEMPHKDAYRQIIADGVEVVVARYGVKMRLSHKNTGVGVAADTCIITRNVGGILFRQNRNLAR